MAYLASNLLQDAFRKIGITTTGVATGGSTSSVIDTGIGDRYTDNDMKDGSMFIIRDAAGASAAPENEWGVISSYTQSTNTFVIPTLTAAVSSGDTYMFTMPFISLYEMLELANQALKSLGDIAAVSTSLTVVEGQTEYSLPVTMKREDIIRVEVQTVDDADANYWDRVSDWDVIPATPGSTGLIILPQLQSGRTIKIIYNGAHPTLTTYNSPISEPINPEIISNILVKEALGWYNGRTGGSENYWLQKENEYAQKVEISRVRFSVWKPSQSTKWFTSGVDRHAVKTGDFPRH